MSGRAHTAGRGGPEGLGEWRVEEFANYQGRADLTGARIVTDCEIVAEVVGAVICGGWGRHQLHTARAALISAAPDLLEALEEFSRVYDGFEDGSGEMCPTLIKARVAIAKARPTPLDTENEG